MMQVYKNNLNNPKKFILNIMNLFEFCKDAEYKYLALLTNYDFFQSNMINVLIEHLKTTDND